MNYLPSNRILNPLLTLASVAIVIIVTALSIDLLYRVFQFIETGFRNSSSLTIQQLNK